MPEQLRARGISWKVYSGDTSNNVITTDSPAPIFAQYFTDPELHDRGLAQAFPADFQHDVASGQLPQVSWIYAPVAGSEHPPFSVLAGQHTADSVLRTLAADPALWAKTVLFLTWDENGAFFDHVPPITAPPGAPGEYVTVSPLPSAASGVAGPIGLGFRVPLLIVSPFTRGGFVCSDMFDHTSLLRFLETRFGAEVPNLSAWRRSVTGDLTSAFNFAAAPDAGVPSLPATTAPAVTSDCALELSEKVTGLPLAPVYPVPPHGLPAQEDGAPHRPSGCPQPLLRLSISPRAVTAGQLVRVRVQVVTGPGRRGTPVSGAVVRLAGRRARTNSRGRAEFSLRFSRAGSRRATAAAPGYAPAVGALIVRAKRSRPK
jgi:phospholipase C